MWLFVCPGEDELLKNACVLILLNRIKYRATRGNSAAGVTVFIATYHSIRAFADFVGYDEMSRPSTVSASGLTRRELPIH